LDHHFSKVAFAVARVGIFESISCSIELCSKTLKSIYRKVNM